MCTLHPRYDGTYKPDGSCARCLAVWVTTQAERYARVEFNLLEDQDRDARRPVAISAAACAERPAR
jgi:hypothetical protein